MTDPPERPIKSSQDAISADGDKAGEALGEVSEELQATLDRIAELAGPAASSMGIRNLAAELNEIGAAMTRTVADANGRVAEIFTAEADALGSLLRGDHTPTSTARNRAMSMFTNYPWADLAPG